ncbi:MAG: hypothetical protein VR66_22555 [Peptococcaceae bacterium BRH_c23]|nr:MAG: hypothetical protein VR66_22555 [Peptococcaceae bacterium BRH_c23]KJS90453.1 MAG: hypothetical protein JL57_01320 [Desulfosporosinus sp. BICA1-9]HBW38465.1 hypothetical protein [Desulfosporosinus sp.]
MAELLRGEVYFVKFSYTFDRRYPEGKSKFVLVLQEGDYFKEYGVAFLKTHMPGVFSHSPTKHP